MSLSTKPTARRHHRLVRTALFGALACLYVVLAGVATLREPDEPEPPCWYE